MGKRQHYIPQWYLKEFSGIGTKTKKNIWVYEKIKGRKPRQKSVKSVAHKENYYAQLDDKEQFHQDKLENAINIVESAVSPIIQKIRPQPGYQVEITDFEYGQLAFFIGLTHTRVPSFRAHIEELYEKSLRPALKHVIRQQEEEGVLPKLIMEEFEKGNILINVSEQVSLKPMVEAAELIAQSLLQKRWLFFVPYTSFAFVTSDNPAVFMLEERYGENPVGPAHPMSQFVMPLRRDLAVVCRPESRYSKGSVLSMDSNQTMDFNKGIISAARRYVFAEFKSEKIQQVMENSYGSEQRGGVEVFSKDEHTSYILSHIDPVEDFIPPEM